MQMISGKIIFFSVCLHSRKIHKTKQQQKTHTQNHQNPPKMGTTTASHRNPPQNPPRNPPKPQQKPVGHRLMREIREAQATP
jgi:hypothetical protein